MLLFGGLDDQLGSYIWSLIAGSKNLEYILRFQPYRDSFLPYLNPLTSSEPLMWLYYSILVKIFGHYTQVALIGITLLLTFYFTHRLFKGYKFSLVLTLIFCFSSYMWLHIAIHPDLAQIWVIPFFIGTLIDATRGSSQNYKVGLALVISSLFSNYYGFILFLFMVGFHLGGLFIKQDRKKQVTLMITQFGVATVLLVAFLYPYISANYLSSNLGGKSIEESRHLVLKRPIEDYFFFSVRPWYFILPPKNNPFLGAITESAVTSLSETRHYLLDDYFAGEHSGLYFGTLLNICIIFMLAIHLKKNRILTLLDSNIKVGIFSGCLLLLLISMPPYVSLLSAKLYTPGYLVYRLFPMIRVTARVSVVLLLCHLLLLAYLLHKAGIGEKVKGTYKLILPVLFLLITLGETFIPVSISYFDKRPLVYEYINSALPSGSVFAVYPYSRVEEPFLYLPVHNKYFLNIKGYVFSDITSEALTKSIPTDKGFSNLQTKNVQYLLLFKDGSEGTQVIMQNSNFKVMKEFEDAYLLKLKTD